MSTVDYREARQLCEQHATSFFLASQFIPEDVREHAYAVYGFCRYADNIPDGEKSLSQKRDELNILEQSLRDAWEGKGDHSPIIGAFVQTCKQYEISPRWGFDLLDGLRMDLERTRYETFDDLYYYCYHVASIPGILMAHLGKVPPHYYHTAEALGIGMQLTNMIRDISDDAKMGRIYFPRVEMETFRVNEEHFLRGKMDENMEAFLAYQVARARTYYDEAESGMDSIAPDMRLAMRLCFEFYKAILQEIEQANYDVFTKRVRVPHARKMEIVQRAMSTNPIPETLALQ